MLNGSQINYSSEIVTCKRRYNSYLVVLGLNSHYTIDRRTNTIVAVSAIDGSLL